jgi:hypothetical protein
MYYILLLVYKWDQCQHLFLFIEFGKMSKTSLQNLQGFARLKTPQPLPFQEETRCRVHCFFAHIFRTHLVLERSRLHFLVPTFVVGIFPFQDFTGLGTRATFVADPSSLCKIKLCWHSHPKKNKRPKSNVIGQTHYLIRYTIQALGQLDKDGMLSTSVHELYSHFTM